MSTEELDSTGDELEGGSGHTSNTANKKPNSKDYQEYAVTFDLPGKGPFYSVTK